jgi:hypothetical protein
LSRHFEYANEQITYHFWLWGAVSLSTLSTTGMVHEQKQMYIYIAS